MTARGPLSPEVRAAMDRKRKLTLAGVSFYQLPDPDRYAPDLQTPIDTLRKAIAFEMREAADLAQRVAEQPRVIVHRMAA